MYCKKNNLFSLISRKFLYRSVLSRITNVFPVCDTIVATWFYKNIKATRFITSTHFYIHIRHISSRRGWSRYNLADWRGIKKKPYSHVFHNNLSLDRSCSNINTMDTNIRKYFTFIIMLNISNIYYYIYNKITIILLFDF